MIKMGVIGYGNRGGSITKSILLRMEDVEIVSVCDWYADRAEQAANDIENKTGKRPFSTTDHKELLEHGGIDAVYVATAWETHVEVAIDAMRKGIAVALEVGGAYSLESLWQMVHAYEETKTPLMFMENCCYGRDEMLVMSMAKGGVFGDVVHCHGAYGHYLAEEISGGEKNRHYRLRNYLNRNAENYPTHELGPIARVLNINRGNRMVSLVSVASRAAGMEAYINLHAEEFPDLVGKKFAQGDIVNTIITCADGSTISLKLDTTLPRTYSREFTVRGTLGMYDQNNDFVHILGDEEGWEPADMNAKYNRNSKAFEEKYLPDVWKAMTPEAIAAGHGGMDYIEFRVFVDCLKEGKEMPIDVYDAAAWMAITCISEASIAAGGVPQGIPDFTGGMWLLRKPNELM